MASMTEQATIHARMKKTDLASGVGAGILGGGIGVLAAPYLGPYALPLVVVGIAMHGWAMLERHRLESESPRVWWAEALYWLCWGILLVIAALVLLRA
jgi:hypothetical protein